MPLSSRDGAHSFVGRSPQICQIRHQIERCSASRSPVLLLGETGVGKEVIARAIHRSNPAGHFVPIDCGSLVGPLMESELFGHVKGAFTGAAENKEGLISLADGGIAFFDEIGDLPLDLQVKLLRVLQEREYRPVGALARRSVDIRVIAATHRDLKREVERGNFRQDLLYRLKVITIRIPPLRERRDDIPLLIDHFLARSGARFIVTEPVRKVLESYDWPGNVRELWNCVQCICALANGPLVEVTDLPSALQNYVEATAFKERSMSAVAGISCSPCGDSASLPPGADVPCPILPLAELERRAIHQALQYTKGDRTAAANLLHIGRTTLYRKLREYGLEA